MIKYTYIRLKHSYLALACPKLHKKCLKASKREIELTREIEGCYTCDQLNAGIPYNPEATKGPKKT